jgi:hypothetical protein
MDAPVQYLEELRGDLGLYPTWLPGDPLELGAFGTLVRGRFVADGRLADLGIEVVPVHHAQPQPIKKHRGMKFRASSQTEAKLAAVDAELGVEVEAAREHAWAFAARGMTKIEIQNIHEVRRLVLEARKAGDWQAGWLLVSELTVLVARSRLAKGKIRARGTLAEPLDILLHQEASYELATDDVFTVPGARNATPLYGLRKLRGFFDPQLRAIKGGGGDDEVALEVANDEPLFA